jgi:hypothetical protein
MLRLALRCSSFSFFLAAVDSLNSVVAAAADLVQYYFYNEINPPTTINQDGATQWTLLRRFPDEQLQAEGSKGQESICCVEARWLYKERLPKQTLLIRATATTDFDAV